MTRKKFTSLLYLSKKNQYELFFCEVLFTCNEVRFLVNIYLLFYFVTFVIFWQSKKVFLKAELAVSGLVGMCLAHI